MSYQPSEVFAEILRFVSPKNLSGDIMVLHQAFYALRNKFPKIMEKFKFKKIGNPYSITLDDLLTMFQLTGVLQLRNLNAPFYQVVPERLAEFPQNHELHDLFSKQNELKALCT